MAERERERKRVGGKESREKERKIQEGRGRKTERAG